MNASEITESNVKKTTIDRCVARDRLIYHAIKNKFPTKKSIKRKLFNLI